MLTNYEREFVDFCCNDIEAKSSFWLFATAEKSAAKRLFAFSTFYNHYYFVGAKEASLLCYITKISRVIVKTFLYESVALWGREAAPKKNIFTKIKKYLTNGNQLCIIFKVS